MFYKVLYIYSMFGCFNPNKKFVLLVKGILHFKQQQLGHVQQRDCSQAAQIAYTYNINFGERF